MRKRPAEWDTDLRALEEPAGRLLFRTPIALKPAQKPAAPGPAQQVPRLDPANEPDVNSECSSFGFRPSDAVRLSNNDLTATLNGADSQLVVSKDWISAGHARKKKSWELTWGNGKAPEHANRADSLTLAPWVGITTARSFEVRGFTVVFDILGNRKWDAGHVVSLPRSLTEEWDELKNSTRGAAYTDQDREKGTICPGYAKVTFDIESHIMNIQFGRPASDGSANTWTLSVDFNKSEFTVDWTQVRLVVWIRDSNVSSQRSVTLARPSSKARAA
jgi:hypothetical protein